MLHLCASGFGTRGNQGSKPSQETVFFISHTSRFILHYTENYKTKCLYFPNVYNHASLYEPFAGDANVDPAQQVWSSAMLVL